MTKRHITQPVPESNSLYQDFIDLSRAYFGNDAPKYISRLLKTHLKKSPEHLTGEDLTSLIDWIKLLATFLEEDKQAVEQYIADIHKRILAEQADPPVNDDAS